MNKGENQMIISIDAAKSFDKIEHLFMMKTRNKLGTEGNSLNTIKAIDEQSHSSYHTP